MEIYSYLQADHRKVSELFETLLASHSNQKKEYLLEQIKDELVLHSKAEHDTFYKALEKNAELKEVIQHANKEHKEIEKYLKLLTDLSVESKKWLVTMGELKHAVEHHVEKEEKEIFSKAKKVLSNNEARELAEKMDKMKNLLKKQAYAP